MKKTTVVLFLAALVVATANPVLAGCGGSHGKAYRAAQSVNKPTVAKRTENPAPAAATSEPEQATTIATETGMAPSFTEL